MAQEKPIIVTSGGKYSDIDTLACGIAYNELLVKIGKESRVVLLGPPNESVSNTVRTWGYVFENNFAEDPTKYYYVLVDISEPEYFSKFVVAENIIEVYDHRWGFEEYWKKKLGNNAKIELVGSCATLIWEQYKANNLERDITTLSARLLYTAILSNTLDFRAQITKDRDIAAGKELLELAQLPVNWKETYFEEIETFVLSNPLESLRNDTKNTGIKGENFRIGQLELWDSSKFIQNNSPELLKLLADWKDVKGFITIANISKGMNYLLALDENVKEKLSNSVEASFEGDIGLTKKLWLRKEIMRELERTTES